MTEEMHGDEMPSGSGFLQRSGHFVVVFLVAVSMRVFHLFFSVPEVGRDRPMGDALSYDEWGFRIAGGEWIGSEVFYQDPFYPYFLGLLYSLVGRSYFAVLLVQACIGILTVLLTVQLASLLFGRRAGLFAGLLAALSSEYLFYEGQLLKEVFVAFFMTLFLLMLVRLFGLKQGLGKRAFFCGLVLGCLCLNRGNALLFVPVVGLSLFGAYHHDLKFAVRGLCALGVGLLLAFLPGVAHNLFVSGELILTTAQAGPNFYMGNNPRATGFYVPLRPDREMPIYERLDARELAEEALGRKLTPTEVSQYWQKKGFDFILENPGRAGVLFLKKIYLFLASEGADTVDIDYYRDLSPALAWNPIRYAVLTPLALAGLLLLFRSQPRLRTLVWIFLMSMASVGLFYFFSRYRFVVMPILLVSAAGFLHHVLELEFRTRSRYLGGVACLLLGMILLVNVPFVQGVQESRGTGYLNRGIRRAWAMEYEEAVEDYQRALEINPGLHQGRIFLSSALIELERFGEAAETLKKVKGKPEFTLEAWYGLGWALSRAGRAKEAVSELNELLEANPGHVLAKTLLQSLTKQEEGALPH